MNSTTDSPIVQTFDVVGVGAAIAIGILIFIFAVAIFVGLLCKERVEWRAKVAEEKQSQKMDQNSSPATV